MNSHRKYAARLRRLYDGREIGVSNFACCHLRSCRAAAREKNRELCLGAEAHVGSKYGTPIRLVVVSLDTGGRPRAKGKDLAARRSEVQKVISSKTNPHMKGTLQILKQLYGVHEEKREGDILRRFAMINSAKCSGRDANMNTVPNKLYNNCREHGRAELSVLDPQLIITQGALARNMLELQDISEEEMWEHVPKSRLMWGDADVGGWICTQAHEHLKYWPNGEQSVLVLQAPHPSARQGQWQRFERTMLPTIAHVVRQWLSVSDLD